MAIVTITGSDVTGSASVGGGGNLTTVGAVPYVSASGVLNQDGSLLRVGAGKYTLFDPTAATGDSKFAVKNGAGQSSNLQEWQDSGGTALAAITKEGYGYFGGSSGMQLRGDTAQLSIFDTSVSRHLFAIQNSNAIGISAGAALAWSNGNQATGTLDAGFARNAAGVVEVNNGTAGTYRDLKFRNRVATVGSDIASAGTIAPTEAIHMVTGTTTISTITAPPGFAVANSGGQITLIPTAIWATNTAGNIALATTAVVGKALILTYNNTTSKWYPSY